MARGYRGHWRYGVQKQGMELRTLRVSLSLSLSLSLLHTNIAELQSVYQDELFFKVKKNYKFIGLESPLLV